MDLMCADTRQPRPAGLAPGAWWLALAVMLDATTVACTTSDYSCSEHAQCVDQGGAAGACEPSGYCSFADPDCDSGRRYAPLSGSLAGECVTGDVASPVTFAGSAYATTSDSASLAVDVGALPAPATGKTGFLILAVADQNYQPVDGVSGGGATWTRLDDQCAARLTTGASVWWGALDDRAAGNVDISFVATPDNAIAVVAALETASARVGIDVLGSANSAGDDAECIGTGTDASSYAIAAEPAWSGSFVLLVMAARHRTVYGENATTPLFAQHVDTGSAPAGLALVQYPHAALDDGSASGTLSGDEDWAGVVLELY